MNTAPDIRAPVSKPETIDVSIPVISARNIEPDSWLQEERFAAFRAAYAYASSQTLAIPALAALSPEDLFYAYEAFKRGEERFIAEAM